MFHQRKNLFIAGAALLIWLACLFLNNQKQMSAVWTAPYLSGAANYEWGKGFRVHFPEMRQFKELPDSQKETYHFQPQQHLEVYENNSVGYLYLVQIAKVIFFWQGDLQAIESLQILFHILLSIVILFLIRDGLSFGLFLCLYALNPLIIYFVTFPYYYFWQVVPGVVVIAYLYNRKLTFRYWLIPIAVLLALAYLVRPTVLFVTVFVCILFLVREKWYYSLPSLLVLVLFIRLLNTPGYDNPWFTMYIGIGGYPNAYVPKLSDNSAYELYQQRTGQVLDASLDGNFYTKEVADRSAQVLKDEYWKIAREHPFLLFRNAVLNFFESFSAGYFVDLPQWASYVSALLGLVFCLWLTIQKQYLWMVAIALSALSFTPYYPPIQAYMYGSFIVLVGAFIVVLQPLFTKVPSLQKVAFQ